MILPGSGKDTVQDDLTAWGAPMELVAACQPEEIVCPLFADSWETAAFFFRLQTAWRLDLSGMAVGLDYAAVRTLMESAGRWPDDQIFQELQAMEFAVLDEIEVFRRWRAR